MKRLSLLFSLIVVLCNGAHAGATCEEQVFPGTIKFNSKCGTAKLCGFSEYTSPSTPPKKYRTETLTGHENDTDYGSPGCGGTLGNSSTRTYSGSCQYSSVDCSTTTTEKMVFSLNGGSPTTTNFTCGGVFIHGNCGDLPYNASQTQTVNTLINSSGCNLCVTGSPWRHQDAFVTTTLSDEDTEDDAIKRATVTDGTSSTSSRTCRGAGQFSFSFCDVTATINFTGLPAGPCPSQYDLVVTYADNGVPRTETETITITDSSYSVQKQVPSAENCGDTHTILSAVLIRRSCTGEPGDGRGYFGNSIHADIYLGSDAVGNSAGYLQLAAEDLSPSVFAPSGLIVAPALGTEVINDSSNVVRQVRAPQVLADIVPLTAPGAVGYEIHFYHNNQIGAQDPVTSIYAVTGDPYLVRRIENPDGTNPVSVQRLRYSEIRGSVTKEQDFSYDPVAKQWLLSEGGGARNEQRVITTDGGNTTFTTITVTDAANNIVSKKILSDYQFPWGKERIKEEVYTDGTETNALTTTYTYYTDSSDSANYSHLKSELTPTGYWEIYSYDSLNHLTKTVSQYLNAPFGSADSASRVVTYTYDTMPDIDGDGLSENRRTIVETLLGTEISRRYEIDLSNPEVIDSQNVIKKWYVQCTAAGAAWDAPTNLVTKTRRIQDGILADRPISELRPDGTLTTYAYLPTVDTLTTTMAVGAADSTGTTVVDGTQTVTIQNGSHLISRTTSDIGSGLQLSAETVTSSDDFGRPTRIDYSDGTFETLSYACCGLDTQTDVSGIQTVRTYDLLGRVTDVARAGLTSHTVYDAEGRVLSVSRIGSDNSEIVQQTNAYDLAGRLISSKDPLNRQTTYVQSTDASGQTVKTTTAPDGGTRVETYAMDGSLLSDSGTAVAPRQYNYGVDASGVFTQDVHLGSSGETTEWTKTYTDFAGRNYKTVHADGATEQSF
jgi:YD repeat-containing protein